MLFLHLCKCAQILHLRDSIPNKSAEKRPKPNCYKKMKKPMLQKQMFTTSRRRPKKALDKRKKDFKTDLYSKIHQNEQITERASCRKCIPCLLLPMSQFSACKRGVSMWRPYSAKQGRTLLTFMCTPRQQAHPIGSSQTRPDKKKILQAL